MSQSFSEILTRASQLGGPGSVLPVADSDLFKVPPYVEDFVSERFPAFSGRVTLRFPTFGDEVAIDRLAIVLGGANTSRIMAALQICLEGAPASWWRPNEEKRMVEPAIDRINDSPALIGLYSRWTLWRDTFRVQPAGPGLPAAQSSAEAAVGGGQGAGSFSA